ncbi:MAG: LysR family transcriptional regulator [Candidimonas sp.]|nr:MAG: LysR family transcriptional regulator [Candidimonas sp.]
MELRQLRYFVVLAEELNFTHAAQRLHISQPPLSAQISQLENGLGVKLFYRNSRRVELTEAGAAFYRDVRVIQERLKEAAQRAQRIGAGLVGRVEVGLSGSHFWGPLPVLMEKLAVSHPCVRIILNELAPNDQLDAVREQRIDVSISRQSINDGVLTSYPLWPDPVMVALPPAHRLARRKRVGLSALAKERFVVLSGESSFFAKRLLHACVLRGFSPTISQTVVQVPAQLSLVSAGLGVALVPASTIGCQRGVLVFRPLDPPDVNGDVHAVVRKDNERAVLRVFIDILRAAGDAAVA